MPTRHARLLFALCLTTALAAPGCDTKPAPGVPFLDFMPDEPRPTGPACLVDVDCPADLRCDGQVCLPAVVEVLPATFEDGHFSALLPDDAISAAIVASVGASDEHVLVHSIDAPDGTRLADEGWSGFTTPLRAFANRGGTAALLPQNADPALQLRPGSWRFRVFTEAEPLEPHVAVLVKRAAAEPSTGTFDLRLHVAPDARPGLTAANALNDPFVADVLARLDQHWAPHGLSVGHVQAHPLPASAREGASRDDWRRLAAAATDAHPARAVHVLLVGRYRDGEVPEESPIGGPPFAHGTGASAVLVALDGSSRAVGDALAHGIGHYLGLYHVTEAHGDVHDVVGDTPECAGPPSSVAPAVEPCAENLMYPFLMTDAVDQGFSPEQGRVMRLHPLARHW